MVGRIADLQRYSAGGFPIWGLYVESAVSAMGCYPPSITNRQAAQSPPFHRWPNHQTKSAHRERYRFLGVTGLAPVPDLEISEETKFLLQSVNLAP